LEIGRGTHLIVTANRHARTIFITGTDTGVGKTVLTALLLSHLRQTGSRALAIKPFCSGGRADAELLRALQDRDLALDEINPFHFPEPLAPLVAARKCNQQISFKASLSQIHSIFSRLFSGSFRVQTSMFKVRRWTPPPLNTRPARLLIEGAGGLLSPLGESNSQFKVQGSKFKVQRSKCFTALDLINAIDCSVLIVAPNRLGVINHTLLTIQALHTRNIRKIRVVLMDLYPSLSRITRHASRSNPSILAELLSPIPLFRIPNLAKNPSKPERIHKFAKKYKKTLAEILA
jgi:dethiobiotin synthetase